MLAGTSIKQAGLADEDDDLEILEAADVAPAAAATEISKRPATADHPNGDEDTGPRKRAKLAHDVFEID